MLANRFVMTDHFSNRWHHDMSNDKNVSLIQVIHSRGVNPFILGYYMSPPNLDTLCFFSCIILQGTGITSHTWMTGPKNIQISPNLKRCVIYKKRSLIVQLKGMADTMLQGHRRGGKTKIKIPTSCQI